MNHFLKNLVKGMALIPALMGGAAVATTAPTVYAQEITLNHDGQKVKINTDKSGVKTKADKVKDAKHPYKMPAKIQATDKNGKRETINISKGHYDKKNGIYIVDKTPRKKMSNNPNVEQNAFAELKNPNSALLKSVQPIEGNAAHNVANKKDIPNDTHRKNLNDIAKGKTVIAKESEVPSSLKVPNDGNWYNIIVDNKGESIYKKKVVLMKDLQQPDVTKALEKYAQEKLDTHNDGQANNKNRVGAENWIVANLPGYDTVQTIAKDVDGNTIYVSIFTANGRTAFCLQPTRSSSVSYEGSSHRYVDDPNTWEVGSATYGWKGAQSKAWSNEHVNAYCQTHFADAYNAQRYGNGLGDPKIGDDAWNLLDTASDYSGFKNLANDMAKGVPVPRANWDKTGSVTPTVTNNLQTVTNTYHTNGSKISLTAPNSPVQTYRNADLIQPGQSFQVGDGDKVTLAAPKALKNSISVQMGTNSNSSVSYNAVDVVLAPSNAQNLLVFNNVKNAVSDTKPWNVTFENKVFYKLNVEKLVEQQTLDSQGIYQTSWRKANGNEVFKFAYSGSRGNGTLSTSEGVTSSLTDIRPGDTININEVNGPDNFVTDNIAYSIQFPDDGSGNIKVTNNQSGRDSKYNYDVANNLLTVTFNDALKPKPVPKPEKFVMKDNNEVDKVDGQVNQTYTYHINGEVPMPQTPSNPKASTPKIGSVTITDDLESVMALDSFKVLDKTLNDKDITNVGTVRNNGNSYTWTLDKDNPDNYKGHKLQAVIVAHVKQDADLNSYLQDGKFVIPNKGSFDGKEVVTPPKTIVDNRPNEISKKILDNGKELEHQDVHVGDKVDYIIHSHVRNDVGINKVQIYDPFEDVLSYDSMEVKDKGTKESPDNKDITNLGKITKDDNTVRWTANNPASLRDHNIDVIMHTRLTGISFEKYVHNNVISIPNHANLVVNDDDLKSNEVTITPPSIQNKIEKHIVNADKKEVNEDNTDFGKQIHFVGHATVTNLKTLNKVVLRDNLEPVYKYESANVIDKATGNDVTDEGVINVSGDNIWTWTAKDPKKWSGHSFDVSMTVTLKKHSDCTKYVGSDKVIRIPNQLHLDINDTPLDSNTVHETPPTIENKISKYIVNQDGKEVTLDNTNYGKEINYIGHVNVSNIEHLDKVVIRDKFEPVFKYNSAKIYDADNNEDITSQGKIELGNDNTWTWTANEPKKWSGASLKVKLSVTLKEHVDCSDYVTANDSTIRIPNQLHLDVNDHSTDSNKVHVTPPAVEDKISKSVYSEKQHKDINQLHVDYNTKYDYHIYMTVNNITKIKDFSIVDNLEPVLNFHDMQVVDVTAGNEDITKKGTINHDTKTNKVTWTMNKDQQSISSHDLKVTITASIKDHTDLSGYVHNNEIHIPNTAYMIINQKPKKSNTVDVTPPPIKPALDKKIYNAETDKLVDKMNVLHDVPYNYVMKGQIGNARVLKRVVFNDNLEPPLAFEKLKVEDISQGEKNAVDVTNKGKTQVNGQKIYWIANNPQDFSGKDLKFTMTVHLKYNQDLSRYLDKKTNTINIPNKANLWTNDEKTDSPTVHVTPPTKEDTIVKTITDDGKSKHYDAKSFDEEIPMHFDIHVNNQKIMKDLQIYDELEPVFKLVGDVKVINLSINGKNGKDITNEGKLVMENHYFKWIAKNPANLSEAHLRVDFKVKLLQSGDLNKYWKADGSRINVPNIGHLVTNGEDIPSNKVTVTPPAVKPTVHKWIVNDGNISLNDGTTEDSVEAPSNSPSHSDSFSKLPTSDYPTDSGSDEVIANSGNKPIPPEIPFLDWINDATEVVKDNIALTQHNVSNFFTNLFH